MEVVGEKGVLLALVWPFSSGAMILIKFGEQKSGINWERFNGHEDVAVLMLRQDKKEVHVVFDKIFLLKINIKLFLPPNF